MTKYEQHCSEQIEYTKNTVDIGNIVQESGMYYEVLFKLLKEFAKTGYNIVTTDIDITSKGLTGKVPFAFAGIVLTKGVSY